MKKLFNVFLSLVLLVATTPINIHASGNNEMTLQEWIDYYAEKGVLIEEITCSELIDNLSERENISTEQVMEKYDLNPNARWIDEYYTVTFPHNEPFVEGAGAGAVGTVVDHKITIKLYTSGSFREILHVYGSDLHAHNTEFSLTNINPHEPDWDYDYVSCYTTGNLRCLQSLAFGFNVYDVINININGIPYWQRYLAYGDRLDLYPS